MAVPETIADRRKKDYTYFLQSMYVRRRLIMITVELDHFSLDKICDSGQCFRMKKLGEGRYSLIAGDQYLEMRQDKGVVDFYCSQEEFVCYWVGYFDLDTDYEEYINAVNPRDKYLNTAVQKGDGIRILRQDLWEMIVTFLISQQNNIRRIRKCIETLCVRYGEKKVTPEGVEYYSFPSPEGLSAATEEELRACGLGYRARYIAATSAMVASGEISLDKLRDMTYKRAKKELMKLCGVGEKVAECICLFALHHMDAFPIDTHIRQVMDVHYKRGFPNRRYKGMRGIMQQYIFYYDLYS